MKCVGGSAVGSDEMFLCVQKHQPRKPLQNSMEKMRPEKQCKHILRKKKGRETPFVHSSSWKETWNYRQRDGFFLVWIHLLSRGTEPSHT